ncbi:MAG: protein kinase, partial [Thermoanaerobaculia bacterium]|nr:protein kinase [Thermoanaerobaculia bacterium]
MSTEHDRASELVGSFSRDRGGPGVLVLIQEGEEHRGPGEATIEKPFTEQELRASVRRCLAKLQREAAEAAAREAASTGAQLTSAELFGDMLAEVAGEGDEAGGSEPAPGPDDAPPTPARPSKSGRSRASDDLDAQIEETLSGVLGSAGKPRDRASDEPERRKKPRQRRGREEEDLDALLDQTLSGLGVGKRKKRRKPKAAPSSSEAPEGEEHEERGGSEFEPSAEERESAPVPTSPDRPLPEEKPERPSETTVPGEDEGEEARTSVEEAPGPADTGEESPPDSASDVAGDQFATQRMEAIRPEDLEVPVMEESPRARPGGDSGREEPSEDEEPAPEKPAPETPETPGTPETAAPEFGEESFGQYTLLERVAVGGMAEVWKARMQGMEGFQKTVAIKRILPHLTDSSDFVTMFIDEAKLAAQLNHPHIIHIYDLGKIDEDYYIAMEYVEGKDLRSILNTAREEDEPFPQELALLVAGRLASGLDYAHRKRDFEDRELGLVHRDVSPQNVLISYEGDIKLCDFGIVKAVAKASKTQMGALKGKLQYMSPEQAWGRVVDARSDIFSLGTVLFEMLTGQRLFAGDSELSVLESVRECRVRSPREIDAGIPGDVERIVDRALRKDPDDRYQTAGEMQEEIESLLYELKPTPSQGDLGSYVRELFGA